MNSLPLVRMRIYRLYVRNLISPAKPRHMGEFMNYSFIFFEMKRLKSLGKNNLHHCAAVLKSLQYPKESRVDISSIISDIYDLLHVFDDVIIIKLPRSQVHLAHSLASQARIVCNSCNCI